MSDDTITLWTRAIESSPVIVLILLAGYWFFGRASYYITNTLLTRIDKKDDQIVKMQSDMLNAMEQMRLAVNNLTEALKNADRRH